MEKIIEILMERDDLTREQAQQQVEECIVQIEEVNYDPVESENILMEFLGLEPDYLLDILTF